MLASAAGLGNTLITSARRLISAGRACTAAAPPRHQARYADLAGLPQFVGRFDGADS
jgi:hypothetical protein